MRAGNQAGRLRGAPAWRFPGVSVVPSIVERYQAAVEAAELDPYWRPGTTHTDVLAAMAWGDRELGSRLMRVLAHPPSRLNVAPPHWHWCLRAVTQRVARLNERRKLGLTATGEAELARVALVHWLVPTCPACMGRRKTLLLDSKGRDVLSDEDCPACGGTGERPIDVAEPLRPLAQEIVARLRTTVTAAQRRARNYLR